jgi:hypothetical protein
LRHGRQRRATEQPDLNQVSFGFHNFEQTRLRATWASFDRSNLLVPSARNGKREYAVLNK